MECHDRTLLIMVINKNSFIQFFNFQKKSKRIVLVDYSFQMFIPAHEIINLYKKFVTNIRLLYYRIYLICFFHKSIYDILYNLTSAT